MQIVTCTGNNDDAAVQGALASYNRIRLEGPSCHLAQMLTIGSHQLVERGCPIVSTVDAGVPAILMVGESPTFRDDDGGWPLSAPGKGIQCGVGAQPCLRPKVQGNINCGGPGIILAYGGYGQIDVLMGCTNPTNPGAYALVVYSWDSLRASRLFAEEFYHGVRLNGTQFNGVDKGVWNLFFDSIVLDRLHPQNGIAFWCEPTNQQGAGLVQIANFWAQKGARPIFMNAASGPCRPVQIANALWLGFQNQSHWLANGVAAVDLQIGKERFV